MTVLWTLTSDQMRAAWSIPDLQESLMRWARDNGLEPNDISAYHPLTVEEADGDRVIRYHRWLRNESGHHFLDGDEPASVEELAPLLVDLPTLPASTT
jgi:aminoglycoside phosphotransferase (APT) family kinase protein